MRNVFWLRGMGRRVVADIPITVEAFPVFEIGSQSPLHWVAGRKVIDGALVQLKSDLDSIKDSFADHCHPGPEGSYPEVPEVPPLVTRCDGCGAPGQSSCCDYCGVRIT